MISDIEQVADLILETVHGTAGRERVFVDRLAWRLVAEHRPLFSRAGINAETVAELLWDEFGDPVPA